MTFFGVVASGTLPVLADDAVSLRLPAVSDYVAWVRERSESRAFLRPWEPTWSADDLTRAAFKRRVRRVQREAAEQTGFAFLIFRREDDALLGGVTLSNIRRGVAQSCSLGYWMSVRHAGHGYMRRAVNLVLEFAFGDLRLHRVEAACIPGNDRSLGLLEKAGFVREGYARRYLLIDGRWQDHVLLSRMVDDDGAA
ncbi:30S ribosomal protein S5 alanine N-acetyltransferase [Pleomorphomonas diazotrophica]|uniref:30S ribosomal protein S5 alanine N-acetyltransferase n=1 Tax=Pleomorphomonas diazotrophica TaxID=1166257 RepID=A0A1I4TTM0_9HYPH|nr:GNAT family protein [Pleomorphomonas diazotrophica]PKR87678.1 30S ribosomal protein S5 alanine N-acetyltransferase [Pleomorphomonas diazotrophica]SFM80086.1 [SSU ribosomal protein S5P]-alanine acetyltransferase [Pleomorphomonas diazotrophica]